MKITLCILAGIAVVSFAYAMGPDLARYLKMRSM
jgi:hypothetical protein